MNASTVQQAQVSTVENKCRWKWTGIIVCASKVCNVTHFLERAGPLQHLNGCRTLGDLHLLIAFAGNRVKVTHSRRPWIPAGEDRSQDVDRQKRRARLV